MSLRTKIISSIGLVSLFCILLPRSLRADPTLYSFSGSGLFAGTSWTYLSTSGYLTYGLTAYVPTTATDIFFMGSNEGPINTIVFPNSTAIGMYPNVSSGYGIGFYPTRYDIGAAGTYSAYSFGGDYEGFLTITDQAAVPEPGSLALIVIGLVGVVLVSRKRIAQSLPGRIT